MKGIGVSMVAKMKQLAKRVDTSTVKTPDMPPNHQFNMEDFKVTEIFKSRYYKAGPPSPTTKSYTTSDSEPSPYECSCYMCGTERYHVITDPDGLCEKCRWEADNPHLCQECGEPKQDQKYEHCDACTQRLAEEK